MRAASANFITHIGGEATSLCRLWRVTRRDGTVLRFTDAVQSVVWEGQTYRADISFTTSAIFTSSSAARAQSVTITVVMDDDGIKEGDLRARKYDGATGEIFLINYAAPVDGPVVLYKGLFGRIKITDKRRATIEIRPLGGAASGRVVGGSEIYSMTCRASLGDSRCGVDIDALKISFAVDAVSGGGGVITADELGAVAENYFTHGFVRWLTGENAGTTSMVAYSNSASAVIAFVSKPLNAVQIGDTADVYPGCDKVLNTCFAKFNNVVNFRGEPHVPSNMPPALPGPGVDPRSVGSF